MPTNKRREKLIEGRLTETARKHKGTAYKFTSPGMRSVPDRILCCPCIEPTIFIEAKAEGKYLTKPQKREAERLLERGRVVTWVNSYEEVDAIFDLFCDGSCNALDA